MGSGTRGLLKGSGTRGLPGSPSSVGSGSRGLSGSSIGSGSRGLSGSPLDRTYELVEESRPDEDIEPQPQWSGRLFDITNIKGNTTVIRKEAKT